MALTKEQLIERRRYLGASEAAASIGLSNFYTRLQLYLSKKGQEKPIETTIPMRVGTALESTCIEFFEEQMGKPVIRRQQVVYDGQWPVRRATLDGMIEGDTGLEVVQAKSSGGHWMGWGKEDDEIPQPVVYQVHQEMICTGAVVAWVPVIIGSLTFRVYRVQRDTELCELLTTAQKEFWAHVETDRPPPAEEPIDLKLLYPKDLGRPIMATLEIEAAVHDHAALKEQLKALMEKEKKISLTVKSFMGESAALLDQRGGTLATWKSHEEERIDLDRLRKEQPVIAAEYVKKNTVRKFLNKV